MIRPMSGWAGVRLDLVWITSHARRSRTFRRLPKALRVRAGPRRCLGIHDSRPPRRSKPRSRRHPLTLSEEQINQVLRDYEEAGFGFYPSIAEDHGECVAHPSWVCSQLDHIPRLMLLLYLESGWLNAQDVIACTKPVG